jgi:hypothetical protein
VTMPASNYVATVKALQPMLNPICQ